MERSNAPGFFSGYFLPATVRGFRRNRIMTRAISKPLSAVTLQVLIDAPPQFGRLARNHLHSGDHPRMKRSGIRKLAVAMPYICGAQEKHQPAAMTSLPGKI
jgi:hypothetical protein